jgi:hypothetical protein
VNATLARFKLLSLLVACTSLKTEGNSDILVLLCILHAVFGHGEKGISVTHFPQVSK